MFKNIAATIAMVLFALVASTNAATVRFTGAYLSIKGGAFSIDGYTSSNLDVFQVLELANLNDLTSTLPATGFENPDLDGLGEGAVEALEDDEEEDEDNGDSEESSADAYPTASIHMLDESSDYYILE